MVRKSRSQGSASGGKRRKPAAPARSTPAAKDRTGLWLAIGALLVVVVAGGWALSSHSQTSQAVASSGAQKLSVGVSLAGYDPAVVRAKAGLPIEITFGQGTGCMTSIQFPDLGIRQDLGQGPGVVKVAALQPGTYRFACSTNHRTGELVVQ